MTKVICPESKNCPEQFKKKCEHSKPHTHNTDRGCENVRCALRDGELTPEQWKAIGQGKAPETKASCACVEVK